MPLLNSTLLHNGSDLKQNQIFSTNILNFIFILNIKQSFTFAKEVSYLACFVLKTFDI